MDESLLFGTISTRLGAPSRFEGRVKPPFVSKKRVGKQSGETDRRARRSRLKLKLQHTVCVVPMDDSALGGASAVVQSLHKDLAGDSTTSTIHPPPPHQAISPRAKETIRTLDR